MNSKEFLNAVKLVVKEKGIDEDVIYEAMELALSSAYRKNFNSRENVRVQILLSDYFEETANCMQMNLEEMTNCIDMELTEFIKYLYKELEK